jgi:hypothetical protein
MNLLFVELMKLLLDEIESSILGICDYVDRKIFSIDFVITQSLMKPLMSVLGKDFTKVSFKTRQHIEDVFLVKEMISRLLNTDAVRFQ